MKFPRGCSTMARLSPPRPQSHMPLIGITACRKLEDYRQSVLHVGGEGRMLDPWRTVKEALAGGDGLMLRGGDDVAASRSGERARRTLVEAEPGRDEFEL